ncbi:hypothetical protein ACEWY4_026760 [Coilia grayii]|uniref:Chemokine interleukin-8-like domain-containing protein n=1 Tax=Coilia grayii TaxID=363190 RepID=A0ABD1ITH9_9TELE
MDTRVVLLLSLSVCLALAQNMGRSMSQRCTCRKIRGRFESPKKILDIQVLPPSTSCDRLEIVVTLKSGLQYCMDPKAENVQRVIQSLIELKKKTTAQRSGSTTTIIPQ